MKNKLMPIIYNIVLCVFLIFSYGCWKNEIKLPSVTTNDIEDLSFNSALGGGNVYSSGDSYVTSRGVVWGKNSNPTIGINEGITYDGEGFGEYTSLISGLKLGAEYYVRAFATNQSGTAYGNQKIYMIDPLVLFTGTWLFDESDKKSDLAFYTIVISKNPVNTSQVLLRNFTNVGNFHSAYGIVTAGRISVPSQTIASLTISGVGNLVSNTRMEWTYSVNDGANLINYTAIATKQ